MRTCGAQEPVGVARYIHTDLRRVGASGRREKWDVRESMPV